VAECYAEARRLLRENRHRLDALVDELLRHETLEETAIYAAAGIDRPAPPASEPPPAQNAAESSRPALRNG
ncbi:MAG TPA: hypothetical protein VGK73_25640, partial [Polyangiaceae bacterium]